MDMAGARDRVAAKVAEQRDISKRYAEKLCERLVGEGYDAELVEDVARGWGVQTLYPRQSLTWMTLWCVAYDGHARWEWVRSLTWGCDADDLDAAASYLRRWLGDPIDD